MDQQKTEMMPSQQGQEKQVLRYSEYVSRSQLYSHLPKSRQQQFIAENNKNLFRCNIVKVRIPSSKNGQQQKRDLIKSSPLGKSQMYSRQNFQLMKKKLKQKRINGFNHILQQAKINEEPRAKTTNLSQRRYYISDPQQGIPQIKGISSNIEIINKKPERRAQSTSNLHNIRKRIQQKKQQQQKQKQIYIKTQRNYSNQKKLRKPFQSQPIVYPFKAKMKKKSVEDNLNVMAWMIKKKVKILDKDQMYDYISNLITKTHKENL